MKIHYPILAPLLFAIGFSPNADCQPISNIPGNGTPHFHFTGPGQEYHSPDNGTVRTIRGACGENSLMIRWRELSRFEEGTPRLLWIDEISLNDKTIDSSGLLKFEKIFIPAIGSEMYIGCRWSENDEFDFLVDFSSYVYYEFMAYWACTLGGPLPTGRFNWYFYISEERGIFDPFVWPENRRGDNRPGVRDPVIGSDKSDDFTGCGEFEANGFSLTLE